MSNVIGWTLVAISFLGGMYACWVFGASVSVPLAHSFAHFFL
ncbi:hypothetical protein [Paenibacillus vietnamensis]|nr:hypothetical protein [Paenibacillus vietnamensis]